MDEDKGLPTLNAKMAQALLVKLYGEYGGAITLLDEQVQKEGKILTGAQVAWLVYQRYRVHASKAALMRREHLLQVQLRSDNLKMFLNDWNEVLHEMSEFVDDGMLATLFRAQLEICTLIVPKLEQYAWERFKTGNPNDYAELYDLVIKVLEQKRIASNILAIRSKQLGYPRVALPAGEQFKGKGKGTPPPKAGPGNCKQWVKYLTCSAGDNSPWNHPTPTSP